VTRVPGDTIKLGDLPEVIAIVERLAHSSPITPIKLADEPVHWECVLCCARTPGADRRALEHAEGCPWLRARNVIGIAKVIDLETARMSKETL